MDLGYQGKVAVITGASSGLGLCAAKTLAAEGATVVLAARRADLLQSAAAEIVAGGGQALAVSCDLAEAKSHAALASEVKDRFGHAHLLVNNAGMEHLCPLQAARLDDIRKVIELDLMSAISLTKSFLGLLTEGSAIVNVSSTAALRGGAGLTAYAAAKGGLISLTRSLAIELAPRKIRVNAVAPGQVRTPMLSRMLARLKPEKVEALEAMHPLGFGRPEDVADAVAFLGSRRAQWITGEVLVVDGGLTA